MVSMEPKGVTANLGSRTVVQYILDGPTDPSPLVELSRLGIRELSVEFSAALRHMFREIKDLKRVTSDGLHGTLFEQVVALPEHKAVGASTKQQEVLHRWQRILALCNPDLDSAQLAQPHVADSIDLARFALAMAVNEVFRFEIKGYPAGPIVCGMIESLSTYASERAGQVVNAKTEMDYLDCAGQRQVVEMRKAIELLLNSFTASNDSARECFERAEFLINNPTQLIQRAVNIDQNSRRKIRRGA